MLVKDGDLIIPEKDGVRNVLSLNIKKHKNKYFIIKFKHKYILLQWYCTVFQGDIEDIHFLEI